MHTFLVRRIRPPIQLARLLPILAAAFFCLAPACATDTADDKILPIGATEWPPFEYSAEGKSIGTDTEIIESVLKRMGYKPDMQLQPWKRVESLGEQGRFAGIYSVIKTPERQKSFYFSAPVSTSKTVFFKRKGHEIKWHTMRDLKSQRVGISAGYAYPKVFEDAVRNKVFAEVLATSGDNSDLTSLKNLKLGRIDLFICEMSVCSHLIRKHEAELEGIDFIPKLIGSSIPMYLAFSKKWPGSEKLVKEFDAELARFTAAGLRKKIFDKYGISSDLP